MALTAYTNIAPVASASAHTKGAYLQIVASTPYASSRLLIAADFGSTNPLFVLLDIATGAAGSETVLVSNLAIEVGATTQLSGVFAALNVQIPASTRLAVRAQSSIGSSTNLNCHFYLDSRALASLTNPVTYGAQTAASSGTQVDPGATPNTKGAYVQLTASTTSQIDAVLVCLTIIPGAAAAGVRWFLDLATGAAGSETVVLPDLGSASNSTDAIPRPALLALPVSIPAGTRLAARCSCSSGTLAVRVLCVTVVGMQEPATSSGGGATSVAYLG